MEVSWLTVAVGGDVIRSFFDGRVGGVEHGAAAISRNRSPRLRRRSFPRGPSRGGARSVDDPTGRPATPTDGP
eukprot:11080606-Lingulodinium_polyedra.AAC.1